MKNYMNIIRAKAGDADGGGGPEDEIEETVELDEEEVPSAASKKATKESEEEGSDTDEFGYEKPKTSDEPGKEAKKSGEKKDDEKVESKEAPATGYSLEAPKEEVEEVVVVPKEEPKIELGYELETKDLDPAEATKVKEFAKQYALTKEAAQALVNNKKAELKAIHDAQLAAEEAQKKVVVQTRAKWDKELRNDPDFGGNKFAANIKQSEKVLEDFFPETKKILTERKSMLPPYVMKDMCRLASKLYETEKLVQGDRSAPKADPVETEDDHLDFYKT